MKKYTVKQQINFDADDDEADSWFDINEDDRPIAVAVSLDDAMRIVLCMQQYYNNK
jgi:hypothetical protein